MRSSWKAVAIGSGILGAIGIAVLSNRKKGHPPQRVALIGDSYAVGLGPELEKLIQNLRGEGHERTNTAQWANHAQQCGKCGDWLAGLKPDVVLVALGVNDGATPNPANYQTIVRSLHGIGAQVVWIEPPAGVRAPAVRDVIASLGVPTVPATRVPLAADGIHPLKSRYRAWALEIATSVRR